MIITLKNVQYISLLCLTNTADYNEEREFKCCVFACFETLQ